MIFDTYPRGEKDHQEKGKTPRRVQDHRNGKKTTPRSMEVRERGEKGQIYRYAATTFIYKKKKKKERERRRPWTTIKFEKKLRMYSHNVQIICI